MKLQLIVSSLLMLVTARAGAQAYPSSTNFNFDAATIVANSTNNWTTNTFGTNTLEVFRYRNVTIAAGGRGTGPSTNTGTLTFLASPDGTNWGIYPRYALTFTTAGTNAWTCATNIDVSEAGWLRPYQVLCSATDDQTNAWCRPYMKSYPRN